MVSKIDTAMIRLWGEDVAAVSWMEDRNYAVFEYEPNFLKKAWTFPPYT